MSHLVALAIKKIRPDARGELTYDYSGIRLAAIKALLFTPQQVLTHVRDDTTWSANTDLHDALDAWIRFDGAGLCARLNSPDEAVASVTAFALGLTKLCGAHEALEERFLGSGNTEDFLWAVTDALLELGDHRLNALVAGCLDRPDRQEQIAYLIGKLGHAEPDSVEAKFLKSRLDAGEFSLRGRCLQSLAELRDASVLDLCTNG